jgi:hypothetical protein
MKRPTHTPKSNPLKTTKGSFWTGWTKPLQDVVHTLEADIASLHARLRAPIHKGRPASYAGYRDFIPERSIVQVDTEQTNVSTNPCNYVVRDGQDYSIPLIMPGPGVFVAHELNVAIFQRHVSASQQEMFAEMRPNAFPFSGIFIRNGTTFPVQPYFTTKFSIYPQQTIIPQQFPVPPEASRTINFFWNMIDTKGQRLLADAYISQMALTPRSLPVGQNRTFEENQAVAYNRVPDGDFFKFPTPWVFERDGQVNFTFRPITPVFQFDSSLSGTDPVVGLPYDDRVNGVRDQRVRVQIEIHGYRYETDQDLIRAGALVR